MFDVISYIDRYDDCYHYRIYDHCFGDKEISMPFNGDYIESRVRESYCILALYEKEGLNVSSNMARYLGALGRYARIDKLLSKVEKYNPASIKPYKIALLHNRSLDYEV